MVSTTQNGRRSTASPKRSSVEFTREQMDHIRRVAALEGKSIADCIMGRMSVRVADVEPSHNGTSNGHYPPVEPPVQQHRRAPSQPDSAADMDGWIGQHMPRPVKHRHPVGDLYVAVSKMNKKSVSINRTIAQVRSTMLDDLYRYGRGGNPAHFDAEMSMLWCAVDCLMHNTRIIFEETDALYSELQTVAAQCDRISTD